MDSVCRYYKLHKCYKLKVDLQLTPYKVTIIQHMKEANWMTSHMLLKERVYNPTTSGMTDELKAALGLEMCNVSRELCRNVIDNFKLRLAKMDVISYICF